MLSPLEYQSIVNFRQGLWRVGRLTSGKQQFENIVTGEFISLEMGEIVTSFMNGTLKLDTSRAKRPPLRAQIHGALPDVSTLESRRRVDYVTQLMDGGYLDGPQRALRSAIARIAALRNDDRPPHYTTVYRWWRKFKAAQADVRALIDACSRRGGKNQSRLSAEVEAIIDAESEAMLTNQKRWSAEDLEERVVTRITAENRNRTTSEQLAVPSRRTLQRRLGALPAFDLAVARFGLKEAERRFACSLSSRRVKRILELVEVDHTPLDILVVNEDRVVVGRPTATVILDRMSRCVLGLHLSLAGHGLPAVFEALRHALMPKAYLQERYADLKLNWDMYGWPERMLMDNGMEFHAAALCDVLTGIGIVGEFAAARDPDDKPHVERFLKTLNYSFIHKLPGTTLSKVHERIGFKAENEACVTLAELDRIVHVWICSKYHLRPHRGLGGRTPSAVWHESAVINPPRLKLNTEDLDIELSEIAESRLQAYGIDLNTFRYASPELSMLHRQLPERSDVTVKWPRHDAGFIWVWNPLEETYLKVMNTKEEFVGLTVDQAKAAIKARAQSDEVNAPIRLSAQLLVLGLLNDAKQATALAQRKGGQRLANKTSKDSRTAPAQTQPASGQMPLQMACGPEDELNVVEVEFAR